MTPPRTPDAGGLQIHMRSLKYRVRGPARRRVHQSFLNAQLGGSKGLLRPFNQHAGQ